MPSWFVLYLAMTMIDCSFDLHWVSFLFCIYIQLREFFTPRIAKLFFLTAPRDYSMVIK